MMHAGTLTPPPTPPPPCHNTDLEKSPIWQQNDLKNERLLTHELKVHRNVLCVMAARMFVLLQ